MHYHWNIKLIIKIVDFLDITLNLTDSTYKPYHKPNHEFCYNHKESNHPPLITKQLPISIETRLPKLSLNEKVFNESISVYKKPFKEQALMTPNLDSEKWISSGLTHYALNLKWQQ